MLGAMTGLGQAGAALSQRTVLITGVSKGLGRALALELAKRGHSVVGCSRSQDKLNSLNSDFTSLDLSSSANHLLLPVDVVSILASSLHSHLCFSSRNVFILHLACRALIPTFKSLRVLLLKGRAFLILLVFTWFSLFYLFIIFFLIFLVIELPFLVLRMVGL